MDLQTETKQQIELRTLFAQNQQTFNKRAQKLFQKIDSLSKQTPQFDFLKNVHLQNTFEYIQIRANNKQEEKANQIPNQQQIDFQLKQQAWKQNKNIEYQNDILKIEIQDINKRKSQYELSQKLIAKKINEMDQILINYKLNPRLMYQKQNKVDRFKSNPSLNFAYQQLQNGQIVFNRSYKQLFYHYINRLRQNQETILKLQRIEKEKVKKTEQTKIKLQKHRSLQAEIQMLTKNVQDVNQRRNQLKQQLKQQVRKSGIQIQRRLPSQIDKTISQISHQKQSYEKAYHSLLQIANKVIEKANLSKVDDYI